MAWNALTEEDRSSIFNEMPGGANGFIKEWGWLHFAVALEERCREKNEVPDWERRARYLERTIREEVALRAGNDSMAVDRLCSALQCAPEIGS